MTGELGAGVVGLGRMGLPMARCIAQAGIRPDELAAAYSPDRVRGSLEKAAAALEGKEKSGLRAVQQDYAFGLAEGFGHVHVAVLMVVVGPGPDTRVEDLIGQVDSALEAVTSSNSIP